MYVLAIGKQTKKTTRTVAPIIVCRSGDTLQQPVDSRLADSASDYSFGYSSGYSLPSATAPATVFLRLRLRLQLPRHSYGYVLPTTTATHPCRG